jgi:hypothetical protein
VTSDVDRLVSRIAIEDAIKRYCRAVDRCDWDLLASVYHEDAAIEHGLFSGGVDGMVDFVRSRRVGIRHTAHYVSNVLVDFAGPDDAVCETYGWASQTFVPPSPFVPEGMAATRITSMFRYVDRFERRDGRWAIAEATLVTGERESRHYPDAPPDATAAVVQQPSMDDPLYALLARTGTRHQGGSA